MFFFFDGLHRVSWIAFVWEDISVFCSILTLLLAVVVAMVAQRPGGERSKDIVTLYFGISAALQKTLFLFTLRLGIVVLLGLCGVKLFLYWMYYGSIDAVYYYSLYLKSSTNLMWLRADFTMQLITTAISLVTLIFLSNSITLFRNKSLTFPFPFEFVPLVFLLLFGLRVTVLANDLVLVILALEIVSFCVIVLLSWQFTVIVPSGAAAIESAIKYYLVNALAVGVMLVGMALLYFVYGTTNLLLIEGFSFVVPSVAVVFGESAEIAGIIFLFGFLLKLGAAPFHLWIADVYDGTDFLVTSLLLGLVSPVFIAKFLLVTKTLTDFSEGLDVDVGVRSVPNFFSVLTLIGVLSVFFGTFGAVMQWRLKRLLAFASLTHLGFILLGLSSNSLMGFCASWGYLCLYVIMINLVCSVLLWFRSYFPQLHLTYVNGLSKIRNIGGYGVFLLVIVFFSFAGIPPLGGFFSKFVVLMTLVEVQYYYVVAFLVVAIIVDAYLYLRLIRVMLFTDENFRFVSYGPEHYKILKQRDSVPLVVPPEKGYKKQKSFFHVWTLIFVVFLLAFVFFVPTVGVNFIYFVRYLVWFA